MSENPRKTSEFAAPKQVVLYDGVCGLCDKFVQYAIAHDKDGVLFFAPLQGTAAARVLGRHQIPMLLDTVFLVQNFGEVNERLFTRAPAVIRILMLLGDAFRWLGFMRYVPDFVLNGGYWLVAKTRYRIFGKFDSCTIPTPELRRRFIE
jgi:predicted DCC family thiol-disulfide oxidoreductase YuxK